MFYDRPSGGAGGNVSGQTQLRTNQVQSPEDILKYIALIGSSLRLHRDIDPLLKQVAVATCEALRFRHCALYLSDDAGFFRVHATSGVPTEQEEYLKLHPLPQAIVALLTNEEYRIRNSYFIPSESPLWQDESFASSFVVVDDGEQGPQPTCPLLWHSFDLLVVPLMNADNTLLGFLTPDAPLDDLRPTAETMEMLELFANQAAVIIDGARLFEEARRNSEERAALIEIGRALCAPEALRDLHTVYQTMYEQVARMMSADAFFVSRYHAASDELVMDYLIDEGIFYPPVKYEGISPRMRKLISSEQSGYLFATAEECEAFIKADNLSPGDSFIGSGRPSQSLLYVPIRYGPEVIGILSAQSYQRYAYTSRHLAILKEIGVQAGIAITNARLYADLREALEQAQESENLKNQFLMTASHELRTPLTAIQGYLELLRVHGNLLDDDRKDRFIMNAYRACDELILLLGNMMDASRLDQDWVTIKLGAVQVLDAARLILEILEPTISREDRIVEVNVAPDLYVWVDDLRLRQVLLNIVGNALKYTAGATKIALSAEHVERDVLQQRILSTSQAPADSTTEHFVVIEVRDWGPGIAPEDQSRLFTRFMRLQGTRNSTQRGAGWGLYLCRQLVEAMGGYIWVESEGISGKGTAFFIALPQAQDCI